MCLIVPKVIPLRLVETVARLLWEVHGITVLLVQFGFLYRCLTSDNCFTQQGLKLVGSGYTNSQAQQGSSVALSYDGNILVSGGEKSSGQRKPSSQTQPLLPRAGLLGRGSSFGQSCAINANGSFILVHQLIWLIMKLRLIGVVFFYCKTMAQTCFPSRTLEIGFRKLITLKLDIL